MLFQKQGFESLRDWLSSKEGDDTMPSMFQWFSCSKGSVVLQLVLVWLTGSMLHRFGDRLDKSIGVFRLRSVVVAVC